jgi:hypothetical protein
LLICSSAKPNDLPALVEPVTVTFWSVMFFQIGVVAVTACAGSSVASEPAASPLGPAVVDEPHATASANEQWCSPNGGAAS